MIVGLLARAGRRFVDWAWSDPALHDSIVGLIKVGKENGFRITFDQAKVIYDALDDKSLIIEAIKESILP